MGPNQFFNLYIPQLAKIDKESLFDMFQDKRTIVVGDFNAHDKGWGSSVDNKNGIILEVGLPPVPTTIST